MRHAHDRGMVWAARGFIVMWWCMLAGSGAHACGWAGRALDHVVPVRASQPPCMPSSLFPHMYTSTLRLSWHSSRFSCPVSFVRYALQALQSMAAVAIVRVGWVCWRGIEVGIAAGST